VEDNWVLPDVKQLIMAEYWKKMKNLHIRNKKSKMQTQVEHTKLFNAQEMDVQSSNHLHGFDTYWTSC
jgi:hypothetical protein